MPRHPVDRYAAWLDRNRIGLIVLSVLIAILGSYLASRMSIKSDLRNLLPSGQRSVRDLATVQDRARSFGTVQVLVEASTPAERERAATGLLERFAKIEADLVNQISIDDGPIRRYGWQHRYLWAELADLEAARDSLKQRILQARLDANPLFIPLDDAPAEAKGDRIAELQAKLADAEAKAKNPTRRISADQRIQLITVQTTFAGSDNRRAKKLIGAIESAAGEVRTEVPSLEVGLSGNITYSLYEHDSVLDGMTLSLLITVALCAIALLLYYRSGRIVLAMLWALGVGVVATFAVAWALIGHLNVMTAFLFAIVVGNGINAALILVARYLEEVRSSQNAVVALSEAIRTAMRGTLAAAATAGVAYSSLLITDFRGFRQFGAIAGVGMALTWIATFTILPAILFVFARGGWVKISKPPAIGAILARMLPKRGEGIVMAIGGLVTTVALVIAIAFIAGDPFTHDWRDLQSSTASIRKARAVDAKIRERLDTKNLMTGQAYQLVIAVEGRDQVKPLIDRLRADQEKRPPGQQWIQDVRSMEDLLPPQQPAKLVVLAEIRALLDDPKLAASLSAKDQADLDRLRPPDALVPIADADVPKDLAWPFIERDGTIGRLVVVRGAKRFNSFDVDDRLEFAAHARAVELPANAAIAGEPLIVADIIETMEADAPKMTIFAIAGSILAVFLVIGLRRHGLVTLACGFAGVVVMVAACALAGLKVHFLDLIALPITIGIGIDYAVNLAVRDRQDGERGPHHLLRTTGGSVLLCSYTTAVGYGTLMLSANGGIKAFGLAALLGELACVTIAIMVTPTWLAILRRRSGTTKPGEILP
ncbi:MAG: MMPL family transporter [Deltaproteobacteria bacterium]|nr:MMPL family transporter [Deltaproteobacteria bacterium]